jgi:Domain of unknown function (DUF4112)
MAARRAPLNDAEGGTEFEDLPRGGADEATVRRLERLAHWLDDRYRLPGTGIRVGLDGIIGLIPGIGDAASGLLSAYIIYEARRLGVPNSVLAGMLGNFAVDFVVGAVPVFGDIFDIGWKANRRNVRMLLRHLERSGR